MMSKTTTDPGHSAHSSTREKLLEHLFVSAVLRCLWIKGKRDMEVLRGEVDKAGYDIVFELGGIVRHVQLKACYRGAKTSRVNINVGLTRKPSGCVVWMQFDAATLDLGPFLWFGGAPGAPLPPLGEHVGRHTRGNRNERQNIRQLRKGQFKRLLDVDGVVRELFGNM